MRKKSFLVSLACLSFAVVGCWSCSQGEVVDNLQTSQNESDFAFVEYPEKQNFINAVNKINIKYNVPRTREVTLEDVSEASKAVLIAMADACGSVLGSFAGALSSEAYKKYIEDLQKKMDEPPPSGQGRKNVALFVLNPSNENKTIELSEQEQKVSFIFCGNSPRNELDSIGYIHNLLLRRIEADNVDYIKEDGMVDYESILSRIKKYSTDSWLVSYANIGISENDIISFCGRIVKSLAEYQIGSMTKEQAFENVRLAFMRYAKMNDVDSKFICTLAENMVTDLFYNMSEENIIPYCKELKAAIDSSDLSKKDLDNVKKLFQTLACSYTYWTLSQKSLKP